MTTKQQLLAKIAEITDCANDFDYTDRAYTSLIALLETVCNVMKNEQLKKPV